MAMTPPSTRASIIRGSIDTVINPEISNRTPFETVRFKRDTLYN